MKYEVKGRKNENCSGYTWTCCFPNGGILVSGSWYAIRDYFLRQHGNKDPWVCVING